jgi:regulator of protease activity HflC (stomatin/prohibitin superfamily)
MSWFETGAGGQPYRKNSPFPLASAPQESSMLFWYVPAPDEALLISGSKNHPQDTEFRIVTGRGSFVWPIRQKARVLSLALRDTEIAVECITSQGVRINVRAVAVFRVGDDHASIASAARRFLSEQDRVEEIAARMFAGHLRSAVGGLTAEQVITDRDRVTREFWQRSRAELGQLGIVVDALEIQQIEDTSGYIGDLAAPHAAAVASQARIAQADGDLEAAEREREVAELKATYERDLELKRAGYLAETEKVKAEAAQAGPLTEARVAQEVAEQQMLVARRQADLTALRLETEVRQAADAEAYKRRALAEADRDQAKLAADAEAYRMITIAQAETQAAKINAVKVLPLQDQDQGRRARLRQRRADDVPHER